MQLKYYINTPSSIRVSDQNIMIIHTVSVKQSQSIIAVLFKREHVILRSCWALALAVSEHVTCDHSVTKPQ